MQSYIKIFSGKQQGATLNLEHDIQLSFGNDLDCDIFLMSKIQGQFFTATLKENSIVFNQIKVPVYDVQGNEVKENQDYLLPYYLSVDSLQLGISNNEDQLQEWPQAILEDEFTIELDPAQSQEAFMQKIDTGLKQFDASQVIAKKRKFWQGLRHNLSQISSSIYQSVKSGINFLISRLKPLIEKSPLLFYIGLGATLLLIILTAIAVLYVNNSGSIVAKEQAQSVYMQQLKRKFSNLPSKYANLTLIKQNNKFVLSGIVADSADLKELKADLAEYNVSIDYQVMLAANVVAQINQLLSSYQKWKLIVTYDLISQRIQLKGIVDDLSVLNDLEIEIGNKIPAASNMDTSQVYDVNQIKQDLTSAISSDFAQRLNIDLQLKEWKISIVGYLDKVELSELQAKLTTFQAKYPLLTIDLNIKNILSALPFNIYAIYTGNPGYLVTDGGIKVFVGGEIQGFRLVKITPTKVFFSGKMPLILSIDQVVSNNQVSTPSSSNQRSVIVKEELDKEQQAVSEEKAQMDKLIKLKATIKDPSMLEFISKQISALESDIETKTHEINNYKNVN